MLREGKVIFSGKTQDLLAGAEPIIVAKPEYEVDLTKLVKLIEDTGHAVAVRDGAVHVTSAKEWAPTLNRLAFEAGITLATITTAQQTLEETFFEMTEDEA